MHAFKSGAAGSEPAVRSDSQLRRSAIVSNRMRPNAPLLEDPLHQPMIDTRRREEGLDPTVRDGPSDAFLKYACPAPGKFATLRKATVKPVRIAKDDGSDPTNVHDFSVAKELFKRCCVDLTIEPVTTINKTAYQTVDSFGTGVAAITSEQEDIVYDVLEDYKIGVVSIRNYLVGGKTSTTTHGGASTIAYNTPFPVVIGVDVAVPEVIAHEIGHALGFLTEDPSGKTVMTPSNSPTKANTKAVSDEVCRAVRFGPVVTGSGLPCCQRTP